MKPGLSRRHRESVDLRMWSSPPIEVCVKPHPTIHCPSTKIGIGRGLELLPGDGCLKGGASQWRNRLREIEGSVTGCFFEEEEDETFRQETDC